MSDQSSSIRHLYFYLVAFIALGFIVGSGVYLLNYVGRVTVFTKTDFSYRGTPPVPVVGLDKQVTSIGTTCTPDCTLTESDRLSLQNWESNYTQWQAQPSANENRNRDLVNALSFLIVALPIFWFHFRTAQRDFHAEEQHPQPDPKRAGRTIRTFYFYLVAFAAIVMFIISAGTTVNTALKTWILKDTGTGNSISTPAKVGGTTGMTEAQGVQSLIDCAEKCKLSAGTVTLLKQWEADNTAAQVAIDEQTSNQWQRTLATSIPFLLASIPLFWLHWVIIQRERKTT